MTRDMSRLQEKTFECRDFIKASAEAEYVEKRRAQNRLAQRNYRKNEKLRQAALNAQQKDKGPGEPATAPPINNTWTSLQADNPPTTQPGSHPLSPRLNRKMSQDGQRMSLDFTQTQASPVQTNQFSNQFFSNSRCSYPTPSLGGLDSVSAQTQSHATTGSLGQQGATSLPTPEKSTRDLKDFFEDTITADMHGETQDAITPDNMNLDPQLFNFSVTRSPSLEEMQDPQEDGKPTLVSHPPHQTFSPNPTGATALHKAAHRGHETIGKLLLDTGADPNEINSNGCTPLHLAAEAGSMALCELLVQSGGDINAADNLGRTALHIAVEKEREQVVWFLIENGISVDALDYEGQTALHRASENGCFKIVRMLLHKGANVNVKIPEKYPRFQGIRK